MAHDTSVQMVHEVQNEMSGEEDDLFAGWGRN